MKVFELVLKGFDGGTDATDDRIVWVAAPDSETVEQCFFMVDDLVEKFHEIEVTPEEPGVDYTLPGEVRKLIDHIKIVMKKKFRSQGEVMDYARATNTKEEKDKILKIVKLAKKKDTGLDTISLVMDLQVVHAVDGLDLDELLEWGQGKGAGSPKLNFAHDIAGIRRHLNRDTGELGGCFLPRCHKERVV